MKPNRVLKPTSYAGQIARLYPFKIGATAGGTVPTVSSTAIATNGTTVTLTFNVAVTFGADGNTGFSATMAGGATTLTYASGSGTTALVYTSSRTITRNETGTIAYVNPGNGVIDTIGSNNLVNFSGAAITNGSTVHSAPSGITLSNSSVATTAGLNAVVGSLNAVADFGETLTWTLVAGTGSTDNASFTIAGNTLKCNNPSALGVSTRSVRVQAADSSLNGQSPFTINVILATGSNKMKRALKSAIRKFVKRSLKA